MMVLQMVALALVCVVGASSAALAQAPIKVGLLAPLVGPFAQIGKDMVAGTELYLDEIQYTAGGRKIQLIVEDTAGALGIATSTVKYRLRQALAELQKKLNHEPAARVATKTGIK